MRILRDLHLHRSVEGRREAAFCLSTTRLVPQLMVNDGADTPLSRRLVS